MAGMIEVAQATVTIIPTMKGAQAEISKGIGEPAETEGEKAGEKAGNKFVSAFKSVVTAAAIGKFIGSALTEGAALQQSIGGVTTLFKGSADTVIAYAEQAYKTVGLSANDYMENVTGFSATLLQGLGNDTAAAAEYANLAMVDMSDNANKMGTDMSLITSAYQGFAKQNYTMLDNLKLGYGGTASEMARLINESGVLGDSVEVTADTVKDVPFDQVISAIHKIQDNLGITGTTALEASTTFSGSLASMKAAGQNLLADLALGESIEPSLSALLETVQTFVTGNLLPMVGNIGTGILEVLGLGEIADAFSELWAALGEGFSTAVGALGEFVSWLNSGSASAEAFKAVLVAVVEAFAAYKTVTSVISGAKAAMAAFNAVLAANPIVLVTTLIVALAAGFIYLWNNCEEFRAGFLVLWELVKSGVQAAAETVVAVLTGIGEAITTLWNSGEEFCAGFIALWNTIQEAVSTILSAISSTIATAWNGIKSTISTALEGIKSKVSSIFESVKSTVSSIFNSIKSTATSVWNGVKSAITGPIESAKSTVKSALDKISSFFSGCKLELPSIKLPHFSISGSFSLNPLSVPHISVSWYKEGGILNSPTIFGELNGTLLGGGEAGQEAVLPLSSFYQKLEAIVDGAGYAGINVQVSIDRFENSSAQDVRELAQEVAEEIQAQIDRRRAAI